jgi:hypothetical protein
MDPAEVAKCKAKGSDCTTAICGNSVYKKYKTCAAALKSSKVCLANGKSCSYEFCKTPIGLANENCQAAYCKKFPSYKQCWNPADDSDQCQFGDKTKCTKALCTGHLKKGVNQWKNCVSKSGGAVLIIVLVVVFFCILFFGLFCFRRE